MSHKKNKSLFERIRKPVAPPSKAMKPLSAFDRKREKQAAREEIERAQQE